MAFNSFSISNLCVLCAFAVNKSRLEKTKPQRREERKDETPIRRIVK